MHSINSYYVLCPEREINNSLPLFYVHFKLILEVFLKGRYTVFNILSDQYYFVSDAFVYYKKNENNIRIKVPILLIIVSINGIV